MRHTLFALIAGAALMTGIAPASADQLLPQGRILDSGPNSGDILFGSLRLGRRQSGRTTLMPDALQVQGNGPMSAGSLSLSGTGLTGPIDGGTVAGSAISAILGGKAPLASPTFSGSVTAPSLTLTGAGLTGPADGGAVAGRLLSSFISGAGGKTTLTPDFLATSGLGVGGAAARGHIKLLPLDAPTFLNAHAPANTPQPDGVFITPTGPYIDFCSVGGCLDGNHLRAQFLINSTTKFGADAQETAFSLNFTSKTGKVVRWSPNTAYTVGQNVKVFGSHCTFQVGGGTQTDENCLYTPIVGGVSGTTPPDGNTASFQDGTVTWRFLGGGPNDGKTGFNVACTAEEGAGQTWCNNFNFSIRYKGEGTAWGEEKDCNNGNEESSAGSRFFMACTFYGGGGAGTFPFLAYQYVGSGAINAGGPAPYGAQSFIHIAGQPSDIGSVLKGEVILDGGNSRATIRALAGRRHADGFLVDDSNSNIILKATGTHAGGGIDLSGATFPTGNAITLPSTAFVNWGGVAFIGKNTSLGAFTFGPSNSGTAYSAAIWDNGDLSYGRHLWSRGATPALSNCSGGSLYPGATDDHGTITVPSGSQGCNLTFVASRAQKPACTFWMTGGTVPAGSVNPGSFALVYASAPAGTDIHYQCMGK